MEHITCMNWDYCLWCSGCIFNVPFIRFDVLHSLDVKLFTSDGSKIQDYEFIQISYKGRLTYVAGVDWYDLISSPVATIYVVYS